MKTAAILLTIFLAQVTTAAQRTNVRMYTSIGEYYGTVYVPPPSGEVDYVLLRGQPLSARISVVNEGDEDEIRLRPEQSTPLRVRVAAVGSSTTVTEAVAGASPALRGLNRQGMGRLPATLKRSEGLLWDVSIPDFQRLPPGRYRVKVESGLERAGGGTPDVNNDVLVVEIRDVVSLSERVEALRVTATRALRARDFAATDAAARQLLAIYPESAFAYLLIGDAALGREDTTAARAALVRAVELLRGRGDTLYVALATEHSITERIESTEAKLDGLNR
jgi:hypothetical protein